MQVTQVQQRFSQIEQCIRDAERICQSSGEVDESFRDCLMELSSESQDARETIMHAQEESDVIECVDSLEHLGDELMRSCRSAGSLDPQLQQAVEKVHQELSSLKHQLH